MGNFIRQSHPYGHNTGGTYDNISRAGMFEISPLDYNYTNAIRHIYIPVYFEYAIPWEPIHGTNQTEKLYHGGYRGTHQSEVHHKQTASWSDYSTDVPSFPSEMGFYYDQVAPVPPNGSWSDWTFPTITDPEDVLFGDLNAISGLRLDRSKRLFFHTSIFFNNCFSIISYNRIVK